jgi:hypothetical protein
MKIYDDGQLLDESQIFWGASDEDFIHLFQVPFGQVAITGQSLDGIYISDFFTNTICRKLNIEDPNISLTPDLSLAPYASTMQLPIYQDSEITVIEMAKKVAIQTNHIFYFRYNYNPDSEAIEREVVLVDMNYIYNEVDVQKVIQENQIVSISTSYPYPVKAFESTLTKNVSYSATDGDQDESVMKKLDFNYRIPGSGVGRVETHDVFGESFAEGKVWLKRIAETNQLPKCTVIYEGIDRDIHLGSKVEFTDYLRKILIRLVVTELAYDFNEETTLLSGISNFDEIIYT